MLRFLHLIKYLPFLRFAYTDLKINIIYDREIFLAFIFSAFIKLIEQNIRIFIFTITMKFLIYLLLVFFVVILEKIAKTYLIGGGDLKLIALLYFIYNAEYLFLSLCLSFFLIMIRIYYYQLTRKAGKLLFIKMGENATELIHIVFAPFLALGLFLSLLII